MATPQGFISSPKWRGMHTTFVPEFIFLGKKADKRPEVSQFSSGPLNARAKKKHPSVTWTTKGRHLLIVSIRGKEGSQALYITTDDPELTQTELQGKWNKEYGIS